MVIDCFHPVFEMADKFSFPPFTLEENGPWIEVFRPRELRRLNKVDMKNFERLGFLRLNEGSMEKMFRLDMDASRQPAMYCTYMGLEICDDARAREDLRVGRRLRFCWWEEQRCRNHTCDLVWIGCQVF